MSDSEKFYNWDRRLEDFRKEIYEELEASPWLQYPDKNSEQELREILVNQIKTSVLDEEGCIELALHCFILWERLSRRTIELKSG